MTNKSMPTRARFRTIPQQGATIEDIQVALVCRMNKILKDGTGRHNATGFAGLANSWQALEKQKIEVNDIKLIKERLEHLEQGRKK